MRLTSRSSRLRKGAFVAAAIVAITACNLDDDTFFGSSGGFGGASGFLPDAGRAPVPPELCESAALDTRCSPSMVCEIGEHPNPACNSLLRCASGRGKWEEDHQALACDEQECPSAFVAPSDGASKSLCDGPGAPTLRCAYPDPGYTCGCAPIFTDPDDGGIDGGADARDAGEISDAGSDADADLGGRVPAGYAWTCVKPESGCPRTRPPIGANCVIPMDCDYGECVFESKTNMGGLHLSCGGDGFWRITTAWCNGFDAGSSDELPDAAWKESP